MRISLLIIIQVLLAIPLIGYSQNDKSGTTVSVSEVLGKWEIDSVAYVNNGKIGKGSPPLLPTFWEIKENGDFIISGANNFSTKYKWIDNKSLSVNLGEDLIFEVKSVSNGIMILQNIIIQTKELDMRTISYLKRSK